MVVLGPHRQGAQRRRGHPEGGAVAQVPVPDGHRGRRQGREHLVAAEVVPHAQPTGGRLRPGRRVPLVAEEPDRRGEHHPDHQAGADGAEVEAAGRVGVQHPEAGGHQCGRPQERLDRRAPAVSGQSPFAGVGDHGLPERPPPPGRLVLRTGGERLGRDDAVHGQPGDVVEHHPLVGLQPFGRGPPEPAHRPPRPVLFQVDVVPGGQVQQGRRDRVRRHPPVAGQEIDHGRRLFAQVHGRRARLDAPGPGRERHPEQHQEPQDDRRDRCQQQRRRQLGKGQGPPRPA
jgi:hypothetical protein